MKEKYAKWKEHTVDEYADLLRDEMEANGLHPERHEQTIMECAAIMYRIRKWEAQLEDGLMLAVDTVHGTTSVKNPAIMMINYDEQRFAALAARLGIMVNMGGRPNSDKTKMEDDSGDSLRTFMGRVVNG